MKSISSKIMWLLFCSVITASLIIGTLGVILTYAVIDTSATENMRLLCKNNADKLEVKFAKAEESVDTLVNYVESELPNAAVLKNDAFRNVFSTEIQKNALHHIESVSGAAAVYLHYNASYLGKEDGFFYARLDDDREFEYRSMESGHSYSSEESEWYIPDVNQEPTWFEAYYDKNLDQYIVSYIVPMHKDGQLIGVFGIDIFAEYLINIVKEVSIFNSGQAAVLLSDGTVLYHPNFNRGELIGEGDPGFDGVIEKLKKEDITKELISYKLKGERKKLASTKLRNGMLMVCFAPESEIYHQQTVLANATLGITSVAALVTLVVAFFVSKKLTLPIKKLNEAAKNLTNGSFEFDLQPNGYDEIGQLTETFIETRKILQKQITSLDKEAHCDGLTGVGNKAAYIDREAEINKEISTGTADYTVVVFDVNKLKLANDVFGHMAGDKLLITVANHLATVFGASNVYRLGGDEYVVILSENEFSDTENLIASCIEEMKNLSIEGYPDFKVSCACGYSRLDKKTDLRISDVLQRADKEMYINKSATKKEIYPWQQGLKGIKQLQFEKYCELLALLKDITDDYLFILNVENGFIRFFGDEDSSYNVADVQNPSSGLQALLDRVHMNDRNHVNRSIRLVLERETEMIDFNFRMKDSMRWANCRGNVIKDESDGHFVLIGRISQNAVKHLYNQVTFLFSKQKLRMDLRGEMCDRFSCMLLLDIDNLSEINLKHGSDYGDDLLRFLAEELESRFPMDRIYHAEKDRFVVLLDTDSKQEIECIFEDIKQTVLGRCSISASVVPNDRTMYVNSDNIYTYGVQLLNNSKKQGFGRIVFFSKDILQESLSEVELSEELEESVKNGFEGFFLVYQPQMNADDYSCFSMEALLRYKSKNMGMVFPDRFIPLLEQTGLIKQVGLWVAEEALGQCKKWRKYAPNLKISVNVSPIQLEETEFASNILSLISKFGLHNDALILEITESARLSDDKKVLNALTKLRLSGIQIAIDDFGTGYSNLGELKRIRASILKVDRVFVREIKENGYNYKLIYNILEFAKSNSIKVCMEGIETKEELFVLSALHPDVYQGYLFDKPLLPDEIEAKYFDQSSESYRACMEYFDQLSKERRHAPTVNMETKTILMGLDIGLWVLRMNTKNGEGELYSDDIMKRLLDVDNDISPKDCYEHFKKHIKKEFYHVFTDMISEMKNSGEVVQVEYLWNHPKHGEIMIRTSGRCAETFDDFVVFEGFHRIVCQSEKKA